MSLQIPLSTESVRGVVTPFISPSSTCSSISQNFPEYQRVIISGDYCAGVCIFRMDNQPPFSTFCHNLSKVKALLTVDYYLTFMFCQSLWTCRSQLRIMSKQRKVCWKLYLFERNTQNWHITGSHGLLHSSYVSQQMKGGQKKMKPFQVHLHLLTVYNKMWNGDHVLFLGLFMAL